MRVLLSIKPEYAEKIFNGSKKFEFRKAIFKDGSISRIVVYASAPVQKVIGEFEIEEIISDHPVGLWDKTKEHSGITEQYFFKYFSERKNGFAIKIKKIHRYLKPLNLYHDFDISFPPQSFMYIL
jgi:predicted transcriptional regulator